MANLLDTQNGRVLIGPDKTLSFRLPRDRAEIQGLTFLREYPRPLGWRLISYKPIDLDGHEIYFTLTFQDDLLVKVAFAFVEGQATPVQRQREHCRYLQERLGPPTETLHEALTVRYRFVWGEVAATYDPRNDSSLIHVSWSESFVGANT